MGNFVTTGALMTCTFGMVPCPLVVLPARTILLSGRPKANIMDFVPLTNISSFGMCSAPTNPAVIAATSAAMGVFTPAPCLPAISTPWVPGYPKMLVQNQPALTSDSMNMCMWLGQISFTNDGQIPSPPPIIVPPVGSPLMPAPPRLPLTNADFSGGGGGGGGSQKQYKDDVTHAQGAGKQHDMMGNSFDNASKSLAKQGKTQQAATAAKKSQQAKGTAADKSNQAVGDVNQRYRETMPPSQKQMSQLTPAQQQSYQQKRNNITQQKQASYQQAEQERSTSTQSPQMADATRDLKMHFADVQEQQQLKQLNSDTLRQIY
ncbi:MAG: DUF4280 domain-containing protein [Prevotella sp.]|nr:DUF4280 domain-containing protein [Prevotella sp.]